MSLMHKCVCVCVVASVVLSCCFFGALPYHTIPCSSSLSFSSTLAFISQSIGHQNYNNHRFACRCKTSGEIPTNSEVQTEKYVTRICTKITTNLFAFDWWCTRSTPYHGRTLRWIIRSNYALNFTFSTKNPHAEHIEKLMLRPVRVVSVDWSVCVCVWLEP